MEKTWRAVTQGAAFHPDEIISIPSTLPELSLLLVQMSQPTFNRNAVGKLYIDKAPDGAASPDMFDALLMAFSPFRDGSFFRGSVRSGTAASSKAPTMPHQLDKVFAVLVIQGDSAAVVYGAANGRDDGTRGIGCWVLDYDQRQLTAEDADMWLRGIPKRLHQLRKEYTNDHALLAGVYIDDYQQGWMAAFKQMGLQANEVGDELPALDERYAQAQPFVVRGLVGIAPVAEAREVLFKGARRNRLREVFSYTAPPESNTLAVAFATTVLLTYFGRADIPTPQDPGPAPTRRVEVIEPPRPRNVPEGALLGVWLRKGKVHTVNGQSVSYAYAGTPDEVDDVLHELPMGVHVVNGEQVRLQAPRGGAVQIGNAYDLADLLASGDYELGP